MSVNITFLGGTGTVTGSKYLVQHDGKKLLIDCGLFQGYKQLRLRNWNPMPVPPTDIDAVILTHAHLDHSGYVPLLYRQGYRGHIHATPATCDLCAILLPDSGHIQEEDAAFLNRHGYTKHDPAMPLYGKHDALLSLQLLKPERETQTFSPIPGWKATFTTAGHILGAASVLVEVAGRRILFSGDLGRPDDMIMNPPAPPPDADTVLIESTYGNREHPHENIMAELAPALKRVAARGGVAEGGHDLVHVAPVDRRVRVVDRAPVALTVDQRIAVAERLGHQHHGLVAGRIAVRMELAEHVTDRARGFLVLGRGGQAEFGHRVDDASLHGLQTVADVRQRTVEDHVHRIVEVRLFGEIAQRHGFGAGGGSRDTHVGGAGTGFA